MTKRVDLQPYLDYFRMLHRFRQQGFLQMEVEKHEAYITQPAIHAMSSGDDPMQQMEDGSIIRTAERLRTYAAFLATEGGYADKNFAVHVVQPDAPHDLIYTILFSHHCRLFRHKEKVEVIPYPSK